MYNPSKLEDQNGIDELLRRYQGRDDQLFNDLETKYIINSNDNGNDTKQNPTNPFNQPQQNTTNPFEKRQRRKSRQIINPQIGSKEHFSDDEVELEEDKPKRAGLKARKNRRKRQSITEDMSLTAEINRVYIYDFSAECVFVR